MQQIADQFGVTKQAIQARMKEIPYFKEDHVTKNGNKYMIDEVGVKMLRNPAKAKRQYYANEEQTTTKTEEDKLWDQIKTKDDQIAKLQRILDQQQQLQLATTADNKELKEQNKRLSGFLEETKSNVNSDKENDKYDKQKQDNDQKNDNTNKAEIIDNDEIKPANKETNQNYKKVGFFRRLFGK